MRCSRIARSAPSDVSKLEHVSADPICAHDPFITSRHNRPIGLRARMSGGEATLSKIRRSILGYSYHDCDEAED
jgi:hypothetical protein